MFHNFTLHDTSLSVKLLKHSNQIACYQSEKMKIFYSPEWKSNPQPSRLQSHACLCATMAQFKFEINFSLCVETPRYLKNIDLDRQTAKQESTNRPTTK